MGAKTIGIDLGTTNLVAAWVNDEGMPRLLSWQHEKVVPSTVALVGGELLVGHAARNALPLDSDNAVRSVKRAMGADKRFDLGGNSYTPIDISAIILRKMKEIAEADLGSPVTSAVITVPAYFGDDQRLATRTAGERAGLVVERIINEPTAAAVEYSAGDEQDGDVADETVVVYDLGGGTFDISVVWVEDGVVEVLASGGSDRLGVSHRRPNCRCKMRLKHVFMEGRPDAWLA